MESESLGALLAGALLTGFGMLVLVTVGLKETPTFWSNAGGYSAEFRNLVLVFFYPTLAVYALWLVASTLLGWSVLCGGSRAGFVHLLVAALNWLLLATIVTVLVWNNVLNLLRGLPLHFHSLL